MAITTLAAVKEYLGLTDTSKDALLVNLIVRVQDAVEKYCNRTFDATAYTEWMNGSGEADLYVKQWPITALLRVAIGRRGAGSLTHSNSNAYSCVLQNNGTNFTAIEYLNDGTTNTATVAISGSTTISSLMGSVVGSVTSITNNTDATLGAMPSTELVEFYGFEMVDSNYQIEVYDKNINDFRVDLDQGILYRTIGWPRGTNNVYVSYTAGYSSIPGDLEQLAIDIIANVYRSTSINTSLKSESIGDYKYEVADQGNAVSSAVADKSYDLERWRKVEYV